MAQPNTGSGGYPQGFAPAPRKPTNVVLIVVLVIGGVVLLGVVGIGVLAALGVYGTKRYLESAKTAEAKNTLTAISRGAIAAYERQQAPDELSGETGVAIEHRLCGPAQPVPAVIPAGKKYQPDTSDGRDFETGDAKAGWKCLRFSITSPIYYQYDYRVGGGYKGPSRGGPDPGPDGFEISAEGDLDGDAKTSLFTVTGKVDKVTRSVKLDQEVFVVDAQE